MPAQRQINQQPYTAHLPEVRGVDGTLYPTVAVDPGESVDWPQPVAGFTGWVAEPVPAAPEPAQSQADESGQPDQGAEPSPAASGKSRPKASAKATDTPEATA